MSPFDFKLVFQNVDIIWVWLLKQSCRTLNLEQLLFLEIFELPYNFGSNLRNKASGNSIIIVNSESRPTPHCRRSSTVFQACPWPPPASRWHGKAAAWLLRASWPRYKANSVAVLLRFLSYVFPVVAAQLRRARAVAVAPS